MGGSGGKGGGQSTTTTTNNSPWAGAQPNWFNYYGMMNDWFFGPQGSKYSGSDYSGMNNGSGGSGGGGGGDYNLLPFLPGNEVVNENQGGDTTTGTSGNGADGSGGYGGTNNVSGDGTGMVTSNTQFRNTNRGTQSPNTAPYSERSQWMDLARQRFVQADPLTQEAWNMKEALARSGNSTNNSAYKLGLDTLNGAYLNSNPYIDATYNKAADQVQSRVNSQFGLAGRTGSGANQSVMFNDLGNLATDVYGQNYNNERNRQQQMMAFAPMLDQLRYADVNTLGQIGNEKRTYKEAWQNAPLAAIQQYGAMLSPGMNYGTSSTTQPLYGGGSAIGGGLGSLAALLALTNPATAPYAALMPGLGSGIGGMFG